ncbi:NAD kinase [Fictibacillus barbaricus]|uniref:NAD kinase n=1 Tax=Fictibacillus barbaricus TaxID=182136 RepID=A0ABU1U2T7_9BACL|nr:NAD kinase [Fictibacillus barbaricus]MDR7073793.1 NAD+ kinase [Fictibacillus barbaricus]
MRERNNIFFFYKKDEAIHEKAEKLKQLAAQSGFRIVEDQKEANIIASIGGDGSFLQAVRKTGFREDCLYVGINASVDTGFYCDFHIDDHSGMIDAMKNEQIEVRKYPALSVNIDGQGSFYCLNECSIRSSVITTLEIDVFIDDFYFETFRGDGMIISTPTGSSAYNKSVNGAVVDPMLACYQISELASLNNNQYRTLGSSFILSNNRKMTFKIKQENSQTYPIIGMDNEAMSIKHCKSMSFEITDKRIKTVKLKDNSFWHKVKRSFL